MDAILFLVTFLLVLIVIILALSIYVVYVDICGEADERKETKRRKKTSSRAPLWDFSTTVGITPTDEPRLRAVNP